MSKTYYWDIANATKIGDYLTKKETEFIELFLEKHKIKNCLEVGCGSGRFIIPIYQRGIDVVGLDINPLALSILKEKKPNIKTLCWDVTKGLPFENSTFDCIISIEAVDYILPEKINKFFKECNRGLNPNDFLLFTSGNKNSYKKILHKFFSGDPTFYRFSFTDMKSSVEKNGFSVEKAYGFNWILADRVSNSRFIPIFEWIEKKMKLQNLPSISPWVFFICKKKNENIS